MTYAGGAAGKEAEVIITTDELVPEFLVAVFSTFAVKQDDVTASHKWRRAGGTCPASPRLTPSWPGGYPRPIPGGMFEPG